MRGRFFIILALAPLLTEASGLAAAAKAATISVSPDGPVATLEQARDLIRRQKSGVGLKEPMRVVVAGGTYLMTAPFVLTPQDSGTERFDETAAGGSHSLKITDTPGLQNVWNPHLVYSPNHGTGTTRCAFDLRIERGVSINHEWRDWRNTPYSVGPSFSVVGDVLQTGGRTLLHLPAGKWVHLEASADLGQTNSGTWTLAVTLPGAPSKTFKALKNGGTKFERLTWLGFTSNATDKATFYLDNLQITSEP